MNDIIIFTDGSSRGNPGPGGWGAIVSADGRITELGGSHPKTTNNRMEMMAVIEALTFVATNHNFKGKTVRVHTDSEYVKKGATVWMYSWQKASWQTKAKTPVLNQDLWQRMLEIVTVVSPEFVVIPGHSGIPANERCDVIATSFADTGKAPLFIGEKNGYDVSLSLGSTIPVKKSVSAGKGKQAYSYVSLVKGKVEIHKTWKECEERVKGERGARYRKTHSKADEEKLLQEFSS